MIFFLLQDTLRDEHGEVSVLDTQFLDACVEPLFWLMNRGTVEYTGKRHTLYGFPYAKGPGFEDIAARDAVIVKHICLEQNLQNQISGACRSRGRRIDVGIPGCEIDFFLDTDGNLGGALDLGIFLLLRSRLSCRSDGSRRIGRSNIRQVQFIELRRLRLERFEVFQDINTREEKGRGRRVGVDGKGGGGR